MNICHRYNKRIGQAISWICFFLYFLALNLSYLTVLAEKVEPFQKQVSGIKLGIGFVAASALHWFWRRLDGERPSVFLYGIIFLIMFIPLTVIYGLQDYSTFYFLLIAAGMGLVLLLLTITATAPGEKVRRIGVIQSFDWLLPLCSGALLIGLSVFFIFTHGLPSTKAFNIYAVYDLRGSGFFIHSRYLNYLFSWSSRILLPFVLAVCLMERRHAGVLLFTLIGLAFYLYSGEKIILFSLVPIFGIYFCIRLGITGFHLCSLISAGLAGICFLGMRGWENLYSLFIRRILFIPANLKFLYYDFFTGHKKIGLAGTLWGSLLGIEHPYPEGEGVVISKYFFHNDAMNSNTGFMAEGYYRFGIGGIFLSFVLLFFLLILIDRLALKTSAAFAVLFSICPIYMLNDGSLIDSLIFGPLTLFLFLILFYHRSNTQGALYERHSLRERDSNRRPAFPYTERSRTKS